MFRGSVCDADSCEGIINNIVIGIATIEISTKKAHKNTSDAICSKYEKGEWRSRTDFRKLPELKLPIAARQWTISHRVIHMSNDPWQSSSDRCIINMCRCKKETETKGNENTQWQHDTHKQKEKLCNNFCVRNSEGQLMNNWLIKFREKNHLCLSGILEKARKQTKTYKEAK